MNALLRKVFTLGGVLVAGGLTAIAVGDLIQFTPGTAIKSADVNQNLATLRSAVQALEAPVSSARLADASVTASKLADASVTTPKLADASITAPKLAVGGTAADGKVLRLQSGQLTWADGAGTPGSQGPEGPKGDKGDAGNPGTPGLKGDKGDAGSSGPQGLKGDAGNSGPQGAKGDTGNPGAPGPQGSPGTSFTPDSSLSLSGGTLSVATGGVSSGKLTSDAASLGKVSSGALTASGGNTTAAGNLTVNGSLDIGYQIVIDNALVVEANADFQRTTNCPAGKRVLSFGYVNSYSTSNIFRFNYSFPTSDGTGWNVSGVNGATRDRLDIRLICARI